MVALGVVIGSCVTALIVYLSSGRPEQGRPVGPRAEIEAEPEPEAPEAMESPDSYRLERDTSGSCSFLGTVQDLDGNRLDDAVVRVRLLDEPWRYADLAVESRTDGKGAYLVEGLNEDLDYQIWAWAPGFAAADQEMPSCGLHVDFTLHKGAEINLSFSGPKGDLEEPVTVQIAGSSLWPPRQMVAESGEPISIASLGVPAVRTEYPRLSS